MTSPVLLTPDITHGALFKATMHRTKFPGRFLDDNRTTIRFRTLVPQCLLQFTPLHIGSLRYQSYQFIVDIAITHEQAFYKERQGSTHNEN